MRITTTVKIIAIIQVFICLFLILNIFVKKNKQPSISSIDKNSIQKIESENLKYYYDYPSYGSSTWTPDFLNYTLINKYNNEGFNDTIDYDVHKNTATFRIITLGDSFTYGHYVKTNKNWPELLEKKLNEKKICKNIEKFEVINLGAPGYDPEYEVERYKNKGQKYNPDLIIWLLIDELRLMEKTQSIINKCYEKFGENYTVKQKESCDIASTDIMNINDILKLQKQNISKIYQFYNGKIFFIDYYQEKHKEIIEKKENIYHGNLLSEYLNKTKYKQNEVHFPDGHPNELGHKLIADIIYDKLFELNQISCESLQQ